ncbi:Crp/Fnr family transcriptional regulator [Roseibium sediminicola]|uniref:Crp/Fnr family transcriptional regulator n=1 Tax=Roseibium sediminicola TaxID=2933272 RepID=A0ABT0H1K6_9HYPH|nr:Crp/Fnr family transcriptional regulator [Roseibium sp. CAU 1639]
MDITDILKQAGLESIQLSLASGDHLFWTGDSITRMYFVQKGLLTMVRTLESGQEVAVQRAGPGELLAEASLFAERYHCDAICETDVECAVFEKQAILAALSRPEVSFAALKIYSRTIRDLRGQIELRNIKRADDRVLAYLALLPADGEGWREPGLAWTDIGRTLGLTHEAIYRALSRLVREKRIERTENRYRLLREV